MSSTDPACSVRENCFIIYILLHAVCFSILAFFLYMLFSFYLFIGFFIVCLFLRLSFQYSIQVYKDSQSRVVVQGQVWKLHAKLLKAFSNDLINSLPKKERKKACKKACNLDKLWLLPNIYKRLSEVPWRPVVSNCETPTGKLSEFLDFHLSSVT